MTRAITITLPGIEAAVQVGRHWAELVLKTAGCRSSADATLLTSELVANAVRHSRSGREGGRVMVAIDFPEGESARIQVVDEGAPTFPKPAEPDFKAESGRGLWLVDMMSASWGVQELPGDRRAVWMLMPMN
ncbi:ATP-binding protein [Herbidospora sp. RD11066]